MIPAEAKTSLTPQASAAVSGPWLQLKRRDPYAISALALGFLCAAFLSQGLPFWDVDYTNFFSLVQHRSFLSLLGQLISPASPDPANWGFMDRVVQFLVYKANYALAGYASWPYLLFRCACYSAMGLLLYVWALAISGRTSAARRAAFAATVFFLIAPGPVASLVWLGDIGIAAEALLLYLTYKIWREIELTPSGWISPSDVPREQRLACLRSWLLLLLGVYLGYKTKADLKLIPLMVVAYVAVLRPRQWKFFALPVCGMLALAVPWNASIFRKPPPFLPGSGGSTTGWMWQSASLAHMLEFVWASEPYSLRGSFHSAGARSLAGLLGPFLLAGIMAFLVWRTAALRNIRWTPRETERGRAGIFALLWLAAMLAGTSALPRINPFFQIRYAILTLLPACLVLAWIFAAFAESWPILPAWAALAGLFLLGLQASENMMGSLRHRSDLGRLMVAVDRAYGYVDQRFPRDELALMPGFLSYAYRLDAAPVFARPDALSAAADLVRHTPGKTVVLSWAPAPLSYLQPVTEFDGCPPHNAFDVTTAWLLPCSASAKVYVMRYRGVAAPPVEVSATEREAMRLLDESYRACQAHEPDECIALAQKALALKPDYAEAYNNLAAANEDLMRWDDAIKAATEALKIKPDFQLAQNNLAWAESQKKLHGR